MVLGLLIRYCLGLYLGTGDVYLWHLLAVRTAYGLRIYDYPGFAYPPVWGYILGFCAKLGALISDPAKFAIYIPSFERARIMSGMFNTAPLSPEFNLIFRTPLFVADVLVGFILYQFVNDLGKNDSRATIAFSLWFFNPLVIWTSAVQSQFDVFSTLFSLLAVILCYRRNFLWSGLMLGLGFMSKTSSILLAPILLAFIASTENYEQSMSSFKLSLGRVKSITKAVSKFIIGCMGGVTATGLPWLASSGEFYQFAKWTLGLGLTKGLVVGGFSPWFIIYIPMCQWVEYWVSDNSILVTFFLQTTMVVLLVFLGLITLIAAYKKPLEALLFGLTVAMGIVYMTMPLVNSQYLVWILPFLVLNILVFKKGKFPFLLITLSGASYECSLMGPWYALGGLAAYTRILEVDAITNGVINYLLHPGFLNSYLARDITLLVTSIGVMGIIWMLYDGACCIRQTLKTCSLKETIDR
jgi:hypothetical protein